MYKGKKILALLPARGGSKRLKGKNIRKFAGKPLIHWAVVHALDCPSIDRLIVSTDSPDIKKAARKAGADVPFRRPKALAGDRARSIDVVFHALDWLQTQGEEYDVVALIEATSPLRRRRDLENAVKTLIDHWRDTDAVVGFGEVGNEHPVFAYRRQGAHLEPYLGKTKAYYQRQGLPEALFAYGGIYISKVTSLRQSETFYPSKLRPFFVERWQHNEIDEETDFVVAEHLFKIHRDRILGGAGKS